MFVKKLIEKCGYWVYNKYSYTILKIKIIVSEIQEEDHMLEYICPKCGTKISVKEGQRLPSLYCRNCMKINQLTMLRMIQPRDLRPNTLKKIPEV